jgi:ribosomal-protein-alanine N-acetyltransferase
MFPKLITERFILRQIIQSDQPKIFEGLSHPDVIRYYGVTYQTFEETSKQMNWYNQSIKDKTGIWWAINYKDNDELIGACGFNNINVNNKKAELGYWLLTKNWGNGIINEVLPYIIEYAFETLKLHRLEAVVESLNSRSKKVMEGLNFYYEGTLHESEIKNGKYIDLDYYVMINTKEGSTN